MPANAEAKNYQQQTRDIFIKELCQHFLLKKRSETAAIWYGLELTERWTPFDLQSSRSFICCQPGWDSTWLTAGVTLAMASKSSILLQEKLLTPIARALPEWYNFSIAPQVAGMSTGRKFSGVGMAPFLERTGAWICEIQDTISKATQVHVHTVQWKLYFAVYFKHSQIQKSIDAKNDAQRE